MLTLENINFGDGNNIQFKSLCHSFEPGCIHGVWSDAKICNARFLQLLTGSMHAESGKLQYEGKEFDYRVVEYYNGENISLKPNTMK